MADYITNAAITDDVITEFGNTIIDAKIVLSTAAMNDLAVRHGVAGTDISTDVDNDLDGTTDSTAHYVVRKWCEYWVCEMICLDYIGKNNDPIIDEKYRVKNDLYHKLRMEMEKSINREVLLGTADEGYERVSLGSMIVYRG